MSWLRWTILACLAFVLAGCGAGSKGKANPSKPGAGSEQSSPTYEWQRPPEDVPPPSTPPPKPGERRPF